MTDKQLQDGLQAFVDNAVTPKIGAVVVGVDHGVVTLRGHVSTSTQRMALRDVISAAPGVRHVVYAVEVAPASSVPA